MMKGISPYLINRLDQMSDNIKTRVEYKIEENNNLKLKARIANL